MIAHSFDARVSNGQLIPAEALRAFEGRQVHIAIAMSDTELSNDEPPDDFDVEKDVYVRLPLPGKVIVQPVIIKGSGLRPCLILPEDLPDEIDW